MRPAFDFGTFGGFCLKRIALYLTLAILTASSALIAQTTPAPQDLQVPASSPTAARTLKTTGKAKKPVTSIKPFSRLAFSGGISAMGINMQAAVNASQHINIRGIGNYFNYNVNNISTNGLNLNGKLNFASAGAAVDFYPSPNHGFRISPGALFYNQNAASANVTVSGGTSFSLNDVTYYASSTNPITGNGSLGLNTNKQAFTITTGWGNMIPRRGGHWSAPFEIGAAMIGVPAINVALTGGQACNAQGQNCVNVATDPTVQANLQAQIAKYKNDLNPFRFYPIVSFGVAYSFNLR
jgi:hypothetical protein